MSTPDSNVIISAFTEDHVERLAGISKRQLRHWDQIGFFTPSFADENRRSAYSRVYSFRDVVCLQVLKVMRNDIGVSLKHLRDVKAKLAHLGDDIWSKTTLYVVKKRVVFHDPESGNPREVVDGQFVFDMPLEVVKSNMQAAVSRLWERDSQQIGSVSQNRRVSHNARVVAGTRIPVRNIVEFSDAGYSVEQIVKEYPTLSEADVRAAMESVKAA